MRASTKRTIVHILIAIALLAMATVAYRTYAAEGIGAHDAQPAHCINATVDADQVKDGYITTVCLDPRCNNNDRSATINQALDALRSLGDCVSRVDQAHDSRCPTDAAVGFLANFKSNPSCATKTATLRHVWSPP